jgi:hypothetical protein
MAGEWRPIIAAGGATAEAYNAYARERIEALTKTCVSSTSDEQAIRVAQGGIAELRNLLALRDNLKTATAERAQAANIQRGY